MTGVATPTMKPSGGIAPSADGDADLFLSESAQRIRARSVACWGEDRAIEMVGHSPAITALQAKLEKIARYREPVLITGESGVGKEHIAQAVFVLGCESRDPYLSVNCPQYQEGNLTVSELFGHTKGSFTGAIADHRGAFEEANGGVIFLDEIGDLHPGAQAMLLRALSTGEFRPLGASRSRSADVRVVSATNRSLNELVMSNQFRYDLFFRLRHFQLELVPLRERGDDWLLIVEYTLRKLQRKYGIAKHFSEASLALLQGYEWPGNVRQVIGLVTTGYAMADGDTIEPGDFDSLIDRRASDNGSTAGLYERVTRNQEDWWKVVCQAFLDRDLNRAQVTACVRQGLAESGGNYRRLLDVLHLPSSDYQRFMDFLRHHSLKP
jgi:DNA-binding NtrC family response regulator